MDNDSTATAETTEEAEGLGEGDGVESTEEHAKAGSETSAGESAGDSE